MKSINALTALLLAVIGQQEALAFYVVPQQVGSRPTSASSLNLFGGANKGGGNGAAKEPGMMERLAMIQKAQQMAQKKKTLDEELAKEVFEGVSADGKVKINIKFIPPTSPMDPSPDYAATAVDVDDTYFAETSAEDLSMAFKQAYVKGVETTNSAIAMKYQVLQQDMMEAMEGMKPKN